MAKGLDQIMANLRPKGQPTANPVTVLHRQDGPRPLLDLIREAMPLGMSRANPLGMSKVQSLSASPKLSPLGKQALHNAQAKAKVGKRLTHADRKVIGKHGLAVILAQLKAKGVSND